VTSREVGFKKKTIHFNMLSMSGLLKTIERFHKLQNKGGVIMNIAKRLFHIVFFL
jgi:hypothetical protein